MPDVLPCCNVIEPEGTRCGGRMSLHYPVYVCDTCRAQCGSLIHPTCKTARKFKPGDQAIVTGDEADWHHRFRPGTELTIVKSVASTRGESAYRCRSVYADGDFDEWNVAETDLEFAFVPVTEEELNEVLRILMED